MILVYFSGLGEWLIRDGHSVKLAITRTTKEPYRDPMQHKRIETYCPDYDEWLGLDENTEENFAEWVRLYESRRNAENTRLDDLCDFESKDYKYDGHLGGIFVRDPNVEGDVYNTNGLRCWGADYVDCPEIKGVFKLNSDDEKHFRLTHKDPKIDWDEFKKVIKQLLPCSHPDSAFVKMVNDGKLSNIDAERVYFEIKDQQHHDFFGKSTPIARPNVLDFVSMDNLDDTATTIATSKAETITKKFTPTKMLMTILGMAMDKYGYTLDTPENGVYKHISSRLMSRDIPVSANDICKCLTESIPLYHSGSGQKTFKDTKTEIEQHTLLKLIIGMAIDAYEYNPKTRRNKASGANKYDSISARLENNHKISVNKGTIQKYLTAARNLLPPLYQ